MTRFGQPKVRISPVKAMSTQNQTREWNSFGQSSASEWPQATKLKSISGMCNFRQSSFPEQPLQSFRFLSASPFPSLVVLRTGKLCFWRISNFCGRIFRGFQCCLCFHFFLYSGCPPYQILFSTSTLVFNPFVIINLFPLIC